MQFDVGEKYHHFKIDGKLYQAGQYDYKVEGNLLTIWNVTRNQNNPVVNKVDFTTIVNGATSAPFANRAALDTWLAANFFF